MFGFMRWRKKRPEAETEGTRVPSVQDFLGIKDVRDGIIILNDGGYRALIEVIGGVNVSLLSDAESDAVEDLFGRFVASLNFPVQIYVQTRPLDLAGEIEEFLKRSSALNPALQAYAASFARYVSYWAGSGVLVKKVYVVVPVEGEEDPYVAHQEILRRRDFVAAELQRFVACRPLDTEGVLDVLYTALNKSAATAMRASDAARFGFLEPVVRELR
ncbi:MAG: hypothetical protein PWQ86_1959 [Bacillota bacterium]|nr:hypothetical protein [Bacillota bacterium]